MGNHVVVVQHGVEIAGKAIQASLQVEDEQQRVIFVQAFEWDHCHHISALHLLRMSRSSPLAKAQPKRLAMAKKRVIEVCIVMWLFVSNAGDAA